MGIQLEEWKILAKATQENFENMLGDRYWDRFEVTKKDSEIILKESSESEGFFTNVFKQKSQNNEKSLLITSEATQFKCNLIAPPRVLLFQKLSQAIHGPPKTETDDCGLEKHQKAVINDIILKMISHSISEDYIDFACVFVSVYISEDVQTIVPLFRVRSVEGEKVSDIPNCKFIDHYGRVYENLEMYKIDNTWDMAYLILPIDGYYSSEKHYLSALDTEGILHDKVENNSSRYIFDELGKNHLDYLSHYIYLDQLERGKIIKGADIASTVTGLASSVGMLAGIGLTFVAAPIAVPVLAVSGAVGIPGAVYGTGRSIGTLIDRSKHEQSISLADSEARAAWLTTAVSAVSIGTAASTRLLVTASKGGNLVAPWIRAGVTGMMATNVTLSGVSVGNMIYNIVEKKERGDEITTLEIFQLSTSIFFFTHSAVNFQTANTIIKDIHKQESDVIRSSLNKREQKRFDAYKKATEESIEPGKMRKLEGQAKFVREMNKIENVKDFYKQFRFTPEKDFRINNEYTINPKRFVTLTDEQRSTIMTNSQKLKTGEITFEEFKQNTQSIRQNVRINSDRETSIAINNLKEKHNIDVKRFKIDGKNHKLKAHNIHELNKMLETDQDTQQFAREFAAKTKPQNPDEYIAAMKYASRNVNDKVNSIQDGTQSKQVLRQKIIEDLRSSNEFEQLFKDIRGNYESKSDGMRFRSSHSAVNHFDKHAHEFSNNNDSNRNKMQNYLDIAERLSDGEPVEKYWSHDGKGVYYKYQGTDGEYLVTFTPVNDGTLGDQVIVTIFNKNGSAVKSHMFDPHS